MTAQTEVADIITVLKKAIAAALSESLDIVTIGLKELTKTGQVFSVVGTFKVAPFFVSRTGTIHATLQQSEKGLEITTLRINEEKGL